MKSLCNSITSIEEILNNDNIIDKNVTKGDHVSAVKIVKEKKISINDALAYVIMQNNNINETYTFFN
ncbi:MAG: DNA-binding protein [Acidianus sp.]|nr:DNA-binding protein [Acidianus sp.]